MEPTPPSTRVPLTVIAGFLGVGKTTTILHLAKHRPPDARWIILVNEFGEIGIDGAILSTDPSLSVRELAGGCLCCAGDAPLKQPLLRAVNELNVDRVLIGPTGLAQAGQIIETLRQPPFSSQIKLQATLTVVDPRHFCEARYTRRADWRSQVEAGDILIANRCDQVDEFTLRNFLKEAAALYPPKQQILTTSHGQIDATLLDVDPRASQTPPASIHHEHRHGLHAPVIKEQTGQLSPRTIERLTRRMWSGPDFSTYGWQIPAERVLLLRSVEATMRMLQQVGAMRIKGVFRTEKGWRVVQADVDGVRWNPTGWRGDSRLEIIASEEVLPSPEQIESTLLSM